MMKKLEDKSYKEIYNAIKSMPKGMLESAIEEHNDKIQKFFYERFSKDEIKEMEALIAKRMKEEDEDFDILDFDLDLLPPLEEMDDTMLESLMEEMDDMDYEYDDWEDDDNGGWGRRRKRSTHKNYYDKYAKKGKSSMKSMLSKMMMKSDRMPKEARDVTQFVKELIFLPDQDSQSMIGSRLPATLKTSMRSTILKFMKEDMPMKSLKLLGKFMYHMKMEMYKMTHGLLPVTEEAVMEMFDKMSAKIANKTGNTNTTDLNSWKMMKYIFSAVDDQIKSGITLVAQKIQGAIVMEAPMPMMTGAVAEAPSTDELCSGFASFVQQTPASNMGIIKRKKLELPTIWRSKEDGVYKVQFCPLSAKWYESKAAVCSCKRRRQRD
eukprot:TRINITY_DN10209_c0_g1_i1.p1 TRINITY_DN10209_c0_g1~~TRINITY_DN10209_c0_g1_i1.p1  ORF type:complete len:402 (-),score=128.06 TRINITY_DN10209_c0_g1_i1:1357-2493(-)